MRDRDPSPRKSNATVKAAIWGAAATVIAAIVGFAAHFIDTKSSGGGIQASDQAKVNSGNGVQAGGNATVNNGNGVQTVNNSAPIANGNGSFSAQGNNSTFVNGSNNQIGEVDSQFQKQNGMRFGGAAPLVWNSKTLAVYAYNHSIRRIDHAMILVFDRTSPAASDPVIESKEQAVEQRGIMGGQFSLGAPAPQLITLCLSFESDQPSIFVIATVDMKLEPDQYHRNMAKYIPTDEYKVFYSHKSKDCAGTATIASIPNEQYFARR